MTQRPRPRHSLLQRQLRKYFPDGTSDRAVPFIEAIDLAYQQFDDDRRMLERSLDLSSQELIQANQQMRALFEAVPDLLFRIDEDGRILEVKAGSEAFLLSPAASLIGKQIQSVPFGDAGERLERAIDSVRTTRSIATVEYSLRQRDEAAYFEARLAPIPSADEIVIIIRDITHRKRAEERLIHDAIHDALTLLPNRTLFLDRLEQAIARTRRHLDQRFAVLFIDLDRFKVINDSLGHLAGDELLVAIAERLRGCIRPADTVARLGGDEFAIVLDEVRGPDDAIHAAERVQSVLAEPLHLRGSEIFTTVSIGIALSAPYYTRPEELLRDADIAMYRAKAKGRAGHEVFQPGMHTSAVALLQMENDLRRALDRDELVLHYQPVVRLADSSISGFEALLRWNQPGRGMLLPSEFIQLAEETGLIVPIGRWVLVEACSRMRQWQRAFGRDDLSISVNISGRQLLHATLISDIELALRESGLPPRSLCVEITESVLMETSKTAMQTLVALRDLGINIHIDDFGTGYSSLSYLHRFPIDTLKIDRSFISHIETGRENLEIIRTIMNLAENLKIEVIAEGIENEAQRTLLLALGCEAAQGHFFSEPAATGVVQTMIGSGRRLGQPSPGVASGPRTAQITAGPPAD